LPGFVGRQIAAVGSEGFARFIAKGHVAASTCQVLEEDHGS